jgi:FkbM family methyltransferase
MRIEAGSLRECPIAAASRKVLRRIMTVAQESESNVAERYIGQIVRAFISSQEIYFFVTNPEDSISKFHNAGVFYEREELDIIARHFRGGVFVDIGAHFGNHALYVSRFLDPSKIIVFEPNPLAIDVMRIHFALNRCTNIDTRFLGIALAASEGRLKAVSPDPNNLGHTMFYPAPDARVLALPGDALLLNEPVNFIKLDVEGMELEILVGMSGTLARWRPTIFVEVWARHDEAFRGWCDVNAFRIAEEYQRYDEIQNYLILPA